MPNKLYLHVIVPFDKDVVIIGGYDGSSFQSSLHRLTCQNQDCEWKTMSQELNIGAYGRSDLVAMLIPDELVDCGKYLLH